MREKACTDRKGPEFEVPIPPHEKLLTDFERVLRAQLANLPKRFDPNSLENWNGRFLRTVTPPLDALTHYYIRSSADGLANIPEGPTMLAGIHSGKILSGDLVVQFLAWHKHFRYQRPLYAMAHRLFFDIPGFNRFIAAGGALPGYRENALRVLRAGHSFIVYPGGEYDASRSWRDRNRVNFARRTGFARVALDADVPIVPVGAVGGHNTMFVISDGRRIARMLGLGPLFGLRRIPVSLTFPWGLTIGYGPFIPLPARIKVRFGKPLYFKPSASERKDPRYFGYIRDTVEAEVQKIVNELAAE